MSGDSDCGALAAGFPQPDAASLDQLSDQPALFAFSDVDLVGEMSGPRPAASSMLVHLSSR